MVMYQFTREELEDLADQLKVAVVRALVTDGLITDEVGEEWATNHTIIRRRRSIFRTLSDKWRKEEVMANRHYWMVVSQLSDQEEKSAKDK